MSPQKSNWQYDAAHDHLEKFLPDTTVNSGTPYSAQFPGVLHNSVILLTFRPENPAPCPELASPPVPIGPKIRNLFVDQMTNTTANVSWDTPTTAQTPSFSNYVQYRRAGSSDDWLSTVSFQDITARHTTTITGLTPNQTYQVCSRTTDLAVPWCVQNNSCPETISEEWLTFTTAANANQTIYAFSPTDDTFVDCVPQCLMCSFCQTIVLGLHARTQKVYLKFNVTGVVGTVTSTSLRLFNIVSGSHSGELHKIPNVAWMECNVTCLTAPDMDPAVIYSLNSFVNPGVIYTFLNLPYPPGGGLVSFGIQQPVPFVLTGYASRDNGTSTPRGFYPPPTLYVTATTNP